ncbi:MAG: ribonuclease E activity regulator RraA [Campylobacterota bacterium]|nr:ribonuclease E activity regulator RraA [Campylobacterota bacterium]
MTFDTADICDEHHDDVQVLAPHFNSYGGLDHCCGEIVTIKLDEDNTDLITLLKENGKGKVAVVDVSASYVAVVGDKLMGFAKENEWNGIIVNGYIRDTKNTCKIDVALFALNTCPKKSRKISAGLRNIELEFGDVTFRAGEYLYADDHGIIVAEKDLLSTHPII